MQSTEVLQLKKEQEQIKLDMEKAKKNALWNEAFSWPDVNCSKQCKERKQYDKESDR